MDMACCWDVRQPRNKKFFVFSLSSLFSFTVILLGRKATKKQTNKQTNLPLFTLAYCWDVKQLKSKQINKQTCPSPPNRLEGLKCKAVKASSLSVANLGFTWVIPITKTTNHHSSGSPARFSCERSVLEVVGLVSGYFGWMGYYIQFVTSIWFSNMSDCWSRTILKTHLCPPPPSPPVHISPLPHPPLHLFPPPSLRPLIFFLVQSLVQWAIPVLLKII